MSTAGDDTSTLSAGSDVESLASTGTARDGVRQRPPTASASSESATGSGAGLSGSQRSAGMRSDTSGDGPTGDDLGATPRAARRRQQRRQASGASAQICQLVDLWRQEAERDAASQQEAAEREAAALAVHHRAVSTMERVAGQMDRFTSVMAEMVATMRPR